MEDNDEMTRLEERHMRFGVNSSGLLGKVLTFATGAVLLAFLAAAAFSAYLRPDMLLVFGDIMSFCAALLR